MPTKGRATVESVARVEGLKMRTDVIVLEKKSGAVKSVADANKQLPTLKSDLSPE